MARHDPRSRVTVIGRQEHLLDESCDGAAEGSGPSNPRRRLAGEVLPHVLAERRRIDHDHRADQLGRLPAQCERDHRAHAVADQDTPAEAEVAPQRRDLGRHAIDRVRGRSPALTMPRQVQGDDPIRACEVLELRGEETAIAAPPMQEQHGRIAIARGIEHHSRRASLCHALNTLLLDCGHRFLLGIQLCPET